MTWKIFCKHEPEARTFSDYYEELPDTYFITICPKCGKIFNGNWMDSYRPIFWVDKKRNNYG